MTIELHDYILNNRNKGIIFVSTFDNWTNIYLSDFDSIYQKKHGSLVRHKQTGEEFILVRVNESIDNCRGRKSSHIIIDHRLSDEVIEKHILPLLCGINRKVEIF